MVRTHHRAAILAVGDEITLGQTLDTNSRWLAARLLDAGVTPVEHVTVADDVSSHAAALGRLAATVDLVVCTGGLGPTPDDLTREALAAAMGEPLVEDSAALAAVEAYYARAARRMPPGNRAQALRPLSARMLPNPHGTAPGVAAVLRACDVFCLPGPPREMRPMFEQHVLPSLRPDPGQRTGTRVLHTVGLGESDVAQRLAELMHRSRNPLMGTTASGAVVSCRIRALGPEDPKDDLDRAVAEVRARLGPYVFGAGDDTLPSVVIGLLRSHSQTVAVVESCTGGLLGGSLSETPGSSSAFVGGWVTYTDVLKQRQVGVPATLFDPGGPGAVSRECALAMAVGALDRSGADHALSITGIAGPEGGSPHKPVGTVWIGLASRRGDPDVRRFKFPGERRNVRDWSVWTALAMLRLRLAGHESTPLLRQWNEPARGGDGTGPESPRAPSRSPEQGQQPPPTAPPVPSAR